MLRPMPAFRPAAALAAAAALFLQFGPPSFEETGNAGAASGVGVSSGLRERRFRDGPESSSSAESPRPSSSEEIGVPELAPSTMRASSSRSTLSSSCASTPSSSTRFNFSSRPVVTAIAACFGFRPVANAPLGSVLPLEQTEEPLGTIKYALSLPYEHAYGPYYGRMFDEIREHGRVMGVRSPGSDLALLPPREVDDISHKRTGTWKTCADTGTIRGCVVRVPGVYLELDSLPSPQWLVTLSRSLEPSR